MKLRAYQKRFIDEIEEALDQHRRVLAQMPTATGKTFSASRLAKKFRRIRVVVHRRELKKQWIASLVGKHPLFEVDTIQHFTHPSYEDMVDVWSDDLLIVDEAHHYADNQWHEFITKWPGKVLGLTATPWRFEGFRSFEHIWDVLVHGAQKSEILENAKHLKKKPLVPTRVLWPKFGVVEGRGRAADGDFTATATMQLFAKDTLQRAAMVDYSINWWLEEASDRPTITYCVNRKHARSVCEYALSVGVRAEVVFATTSAAKRTKIYDRFERGETQMMITVAVLTEGVDFPWCSAVLVIRPTRSLVLWLQMAGRAARWVHGKDHGLVLDASGNCARLGHPDDNHLWSLSARVDDIRPPKICIWCGTANHPDNEVCENCGNELRMPAGKQGERIVCDICGRTRRITLSQCPYCQMNVLTADATLADRPQNFGHRNTLWESNDPEIDPLRYEAEIKALESTAWLEQRNGHWVGGLNVDGEESIAWNITRVFPTGAIPVERQPQIQGPLPYKVVDRILNRARTVMRDL